MKRIAWFGALLIFAAAFFYGPVQLEKSSNRVYFLPPYRASEQARQLHRSLAVVDLHADSLLWNRDLLVRGTRGHVDIPRLIEGNVALQMFTVVTKTPWFLNIERNGDRTDSITLLALAERWPPRTWFSLKQRALYQAGRLQQFALGSGGKFVLVRSAKDLSDYLEQRQKHPEMTAGILGLEGAHALEGKLANLDVLFDAGFRMVAPTHFFDNEIGGSAHGEKKGGLTELGKEMIRKMEVKHMLVDVAHASPKTIKDVLAIATKPVVDSHTGVKGTCNNIRNLSDDEIRGIARTGGVIGIGFWDTAVCGRDAKAIAHAIRYGADLVGVEHVGLGSDFDGDVATPFDTTGLVQLTEALQTEGFSEPEIRMIMGGNALSVLLQVLPR